jgi:hypothetical protein
MIHPNYAVPLTDRLGREIDEGDEVFVPVRNLKRPPWGGVLVRAKIRKIDPLFERSGNWLSTGPDSRTPFVRVSQINTKKATEYLVPALQGEGYNGAPDLSKASIVSVEHPNGTTTSHWFNDLVKVSDG